ncbi:hypothetical protein PBT90_04245 [Algoriphagus halophytocola]|uniref:Universal stress protein n=1 Tax=Algoriphagus halophytocola TaxID=2991499 RepID=A0ABY6MFN0_9BACT|nr:MULTISPECIES: hypothetical protein [unclassified Algoriphagus]UZD22628.1 hypothetical protein OM944_18505 [Algoriphagus sp. TR-M5]WBL43894.1 hypothetical protein PBT90_04245 [Algoriphagus sp. TR-M9]
MAKTILIPTDFTVDSLNLVKLALQKNQQSGEKLRVILVYGQWMSSSITELLFYSKSRALDQLESPEFKSCCKLLMEKYDSIIEQMSLDLFSGTNQNAFQNYLEGNQIAEAYYSTHYTFKLKNSSSFSLIPFLTRSKINLVEMNWDSANQPNAGNQQDELSALFFTHGQMAH